MRPAHDEGTLRCPGQANASTDSSVIYTMPRVSYSVLIEQQHVPVRLVPEVLQSRGRAENNVSCRADVVCDDLEILRRSTAPRCGRSIWCCNAASIERSVQRHRGTHVGPVTVAETVCRARHGCGNCVEQARLCATSINLKAHITLPKIRTNARFKFCVARSLG